MLSMELLWKEAVLGGGRRRRWEADQEGLITQTGRRRGEEEDPHLTTAFPSQPRRRRADPRLRPARAASVGFGEESSWKEEQER